MGIIMGCLGELSRLTKSKGAPSKGERGGLYFLT